MKHLYAFTLVPVFIALLGCIAAGQTSPTPTPAPQGGTGVEGVITISPTRGGPMRKGDAESKPLPNTSFVVKQGDRTVASFETDAAGHFRVSLPPGQYQVAKPDAQRGVGHFGPFPVEVTAAKMTHVTWECDSGIR